MKPLQIRFPQKTDLAIQDLAESLGVNQSMVARAAMQIGLQHIKNAAAKSVEQGRNLACIEDAKSKL